MRIDAGAQIGSDMDGELDVGVGSCSGPERGDLSAATHTGPGDVRVCLLCVRLVRPSPRRVQITVPVGHQCAETGVRPWLGGELHRLLTCSFNRAVDEAVAAAYAYFQPGS